MHAFWTINVFPFHQDVEKFADQQDEKVESWGNSRDLEVESHPLLEKSSKKGRKNQLRERTENVHGKRLLWMI